jgi:hypothetical protein
MDTLGALIVRDIKTGVEFNIGTGFDDMTRKLWWERYKSLGAVTMDTSGCTIIRFPEPVEIVTYTFFPSGSKDKPRFPVHKGTRKDL